MRSETLIWSCRRNFSGFWKPEDFAGLEKLKSHRWTRGSFLPPIRLDLQKAMKKGALREDLFYRMDVIQISLPPLRDRPEDIECLARHFLKMDAAESEPKKISAEAIRMLNAYAWPGNIRELKSVINKGTILAESDTITADDLPNHLSFNKRELPRRLKTLQDVERDHILEVLGETGGNQSNASQILGNQPKDSI